MRVGLLWDLPYLLPEQTWKWLTMLHVLDYVIVYFGSKIVKLVTEG
jgi:hypothetical protein